MNEAVKYTLWHVSADETRFLKNSFIYPQSLVHQQWQIMLMTVNVHTAICFSVALLTETFSLLGIMDGLKKCGQSLNSYHFPHTSANPCFWPLLTFRVSDLIDLDSA